MTMKTIFEDKQMEREVLCCALLQSSAIYDIMDLEESDFVQYEHKEIFRAMTEMHDKNQEIDITTLIATLKEMGCTHYENGTFLIEYARVPYIASVRHRITELKKYSRNRILKQAVLKLSDSINGNCNQDEGFELLNEYFEKEYSNNIDGITFHEMAHYDLSELYGKDSFIPTNIDSIDSIVNGIYPTQLFCIAARPGNGKTTLALNIANAINVNTLMFSLEMSRKELYAKFLAMNSGINSNTIESGKLSSKDIEVLGKVHASLRHKTIKIYDNKRNINKIINIIKKEKPAVVIIDYLQLITGAKGINPNERVSHVTSMLKNTCLELKIPIVILSQLSRECEKQNREPILSDLRDSGSIEQDSDVVMLLHNTSDEVTLNPIVKITCSKNRKGRTSFNEMYFNKEISKFDKIRGNYV
jgi:replicative DNA helicase